MLGIMFGDMDNVRSQGWGKALVLGIMFGDRDNVRSQG